MVERSAEHAAAPRADATSQPLTMVEGDATSSEVLGRRCAPAGRVDQLTCCVGVFDHYAWVRELPVSDLVAAAEET
ncbi:hypothetical protein AB0F91_06580 [Amycolatopsis sp. NPDC023774]|uniref:hypothetical protein n=1 Tax=Amycolatopsis sp. NPDC023774 TaxID=3155015 RepID=UPI0033D3B5C9